MYGHYAGQGKPFSCQTTKDKTVARTVAVNPIVRRTEGEREAYSDGYLAALDLSIKKVDSCVSTVTAATSLRNVREGFLVARGEK
jgi:hypothetical protein